MLTRQSFRNTHHKSTHNKCQMFFRALFCNLQLYFRKRHDIQIDFWCILCDYACKLNNLFFCSLTCVWEWEKVYRINFNTAFWNHMTCNRAVNTARQKQGCLWACAYRHTALSLHFIFICINVCTEISDFDFNRNFGIMNVNDYIRIFVVKITADFHTNLRWVKRELLIRTLCLNLKFNAILKVFLQIFLSFCLYILNILFTNNRSCNWNNTEYFRQSFHYNIHFILIENFDINCSLCKSCLYLRHIFQWISDVVHQYIFKLRTITAL